MRNWLTRMLLMLALAVMMLSTAALAQTEEEFILTCSTKTSGETAVYLSQDGKYTENGVLPAGTYVRCTGVEDEVAGAKNKEKFIYAECLVYGQEGLETVWVKADALVPAWTLVYFQDGAYVKLHDRIANDPQALADYCGTYFPGREYSFDAMDPAFVSDVTISEDWTVQQFGEGSMALSARLVTLGLNTSVVTTKQGELTVPTKHLIFGSTMDASQQIGVVLAPNTGEASLREKAAGNGKVIAKCKAGRVVVVLEEAGATYRKIRYDGEEGYIRTDCLVFPENTDAPMGVGTLHMNGATDGAKQVTVRCTASSSTAKVAALATGTEVIVYAEEGKWYAVEKDGWFGYVQQQYLTLNDK